MDDLAQEFHNVVANVLGQSSSDSQAAQPDQNVDLNQSDQSMVPQGSLQPTEEAYTPPPAPQEQDPAAWYDQTFRQYRVDNPNASEQDAYDHMTNLINPQPTALPPGADPFYAHDQPDQPYQSPAVPDNSNAVTNDIVNTVTNYADNAKKNLSDIQSAGNTLAESNPLALTGTPMGQVSQPAEQQQIQPVPQTDQQKEDLANFQKPVDALSDQNIKPILGAAAFVNPIAAAAYLPYAASDMIKAYNQGGATKVARDFTYGQIQDFRRQPDLQQQFQDKPVSTAINRIMSALPLALIGHGAFEGGRSILRDNPELPRNITDAVNNERGSVGPVDDNTETTKPEEQPAAEEKPLHDQFVDTVQQTLGNADLPEPAPSTQETPIVDQQPTAFKPQFEHDLDNEKTNLVDTLSKAGVDPDLSSKIADGVVNDRRQNLRATDDVTGYQKPEYLQPTLERSWNDHVNNGDNFSLASVDFANLGGLNQHVNNISDVANAHYRAVTDIIKQSVEDSGINNAQFIRSGGDEFQILAPGVSKNVLDNAMDNARMKVQSYAEDNGLSNILHPKTGLNSGIGIHYGVEDMSSVNSIANLKRSAETDLSLSKQALKEGGTQNVGGSEIAASRSLPPEGQSSGVEEGPRTDSTGLPETANNATATQEVESPNGGSFDLNKPLHEQFVDIVNDKMKSNEQKKIEYINEFQNNLPDEDFETFEKRYEREHPEKYREGEPIQPENIPSTFEDKLQGNKVTNGFVSQDIAPVVRGAIESANSIKNFVSPASVNVHTRFSADTIREYNATSKLDYARSEKGLEAADKYFKSKTSAEQINDAIAYQKGELSDPVLKPYVDAMQEQLNSRGETLKQMGVLEDFDKNYLPQIWKNTPKNSAILSAYQENLFKANKGFLKEKIIPNYETGIKIGMEPLYTNPVDMAMHRIKQEDHYIMGERIKTELSNAGEIKLVSEGQRIPEGWKQINAENNPLGPSASGAYYARPEVAKLIENFLGKGWQNEPLYKGYMKAANTMNQLQLLGFFHVGKTAWETSVSKATLVPQLASDAIGNMAKGNFKKAAGNIVDAISNVPGPSTPFTTWNSGNKFMKTLLDHKHDNDPLVQAYKAGGGQVGLGKEFTTKYYSSLRKAWVSGNYVGSALRAPFAAAERLTGLVMEKWVPMEKAGAFKQQMDYELKRDPSLISDRPRLRSVSAKIIDNLDNLEGSINWDNLFLNPKFKQTLFATMRAPGFSGGTIRSIGGGVLDAVTTKQRMARGDKFMSQRMAYDLALPIMAIAGNYAMQWFETGEQPDLSKEGFRLLYEHKNGQTDDWGNPKYSGVPSYTKDVASWFRQPLWTTISNKAHPLLSAMAQIANNKDYYGTQIYNPKDDFGTRQMDKVKFISKNLAPFGVTNAVKLAGVSGDGLIDTAQNYADYLTNNGPKNAINAVAAQFGISPTPSNLTMTDAQKEAREIIQSKMPDTKNQEQGDKIQLKSQLRKDSVGKEQVPQSIIDALHSGQISKDDARDIWKQRNEQPLERSVASSEISIDDAIDIWSKANDTEKEQIRPEIIKKLKNELHSSNATPIQKQKALDYYHRYFQR